MRKSEDKDNTLVKNLCTEHRCSAAFMISVQKMSLETDVILKEKYQREDSQERKSKYMKDNSRLKTVVAAHLCVFIAEKQR